MLVLSGAGARARTTKASLACVRGFVNELLLSLLCKSNVGLLRSERTSSSTITLRIAQQSPLRKL